MFCPPGAHEYTYGPAAPTGVAVAVPVVAPVQVVVLAIVGGQQEITALKLAEPSLAHPALVQLPDSPSPDVFTVIAKLNPGLHPANTVTFQQKFQSPPPGLITIPANPNAPSPKLLPGLPSFRASSK